MNNKGFTLVEIIAVIALIGVIMLLVVPNITDSYKSAQKNLFYDNVISIYNASTTSFLYDEDSNKFCSSGTTLSVDIQDDITYYVEVTSYGEVTKLNVSNGDYYISLSDTNGIKKSSIKKSSINEGNVTYNCDGTSTTAYKDTECKISNSNRACYISDFSYIYNNSLS